MEAKKNHTLLGIALVKFHHANCKVLVEVVELKCLHVLYYELRRVTLH